MKLADQSKKEILITFNIRKVSQIKTWMQSYRNSELHRLKEPVGKQYSFGKGPEYESETSNFQADNHYLKQQVEVLKKYA